MDLENHWLTTVGLITSSLIAITSNFLLLLVFCRRRGLRTISNRFVISLLFANLLSGVLVIPFLVVSLRPKLDAVPLLENVNVSSSEIVEKIRPTSPVLSEIVYERHSSRLVNGTLFESRQLLIDERSNGDDEELELFEASFSVDVAGRSGNPLFCHVSQFVLNLACTASILSILLIGVEQYTAVLHPLRCHSYMSKAKSSVLIVATWIVSGMFAVGTSATNSNAGFFRGFCPKVEPNSASLTFAVVYFTVVIFAPFATVCLIYVLIYNAAHKNSSRLRKRTTRNIITRKHSVFTAIPTEETTDVGEGHMLNNVLVDDGASKLSVGLPKIRSAPNFTDLSRVNELREFARPEPQKQISINRTHSERVPKNLITSLKLRISNASVFRYREENRTAKISILVIFMVLFCYVPYGVMFILNTTLPPSPALRNLTHIAVLLFISANLLSPILFAYRNRRVQRELKKFLTLRPSKERYAATTQPRIVVNHIETDLNKSTECVVADAEPFLVPEVVVDCKLDTDKKSILKRVCSKNWSNYKKCSFINVPDGCLDARGSFSSASTQISTEE